jgi:hypothetical protein
MAIDHGGVMKRVITSLLVLTSILLAGTANAECGTNSCIAYIDMVYIEANGNMYVQTSATETLANCTPDSNVYFFLSGTASKFKEVYAMLLTAEVLGWQMRIRIVEGTNPCAISWVAVDRQ